MKKIMTMVMALVMAASMASCGNAAEDTANTAAAAKTQQAAAAKVISAEEETYTIETDDTLVGGWAVPEDTGIEKNPEAKAALDKALEVITGAEYEPLAVLGKQIVAGTNYCILCRETYIVPDAQPKMVLVYVYEDLGGKAEITGSKEIIGELLDGGFAANAGDVSIEKNPETKAAFDKAMECITGMSYEPIACLGTQVVAGTNHLVLCKGTATVPDAKPVFTLVTVYEDLNDGAEMIEAADLTLGETDSIDE